MIQKALQITRWLRDIFLNFINSSGGESHQQNITVVGDNIKVIIIDGNKHPNLMLPERKNKVKHFPRKNCKNSKRNQKRLESGKRGRRS